MRVLCERHIPPQYSEALESEAWSTVSSTDGLFHPEATDETIARYAADNDWVVLTRDRDFFDPATRFGFGVLYLDMRRSPAPGIRVTAIKTIGDAYTDHEEILESVPGNWI